MTSDFPPSRAAALERLHAFVPQMGRSYAEARNIDRGPDATPSVSMLSPYVRHRLLLEEELVDAAVAAHGPAAQRFVDQVMWRSYWKGWLEHHPSVWPAYRATLRRDMNRLAVEEGLRRVFHDATEGRTGIECFDAWAHELVAHNWLHNHARMWFASIWVFTLRLPWSLGANFFLRHLLDGDAASNTLSWRWVAGLHTAGKCYVARAENIARFTEGRFNPAGQLDESADAVSEPASWQAAPTSCPTPQAAGDPPHGEVALLVHDEDCLPETLDLASAIVVQVGSVSAHRTLASPGTAARVTAFAQEAVADAVSRRSTAATALAPYEVKDWVMRQDRPVIAAYPTIGATADLLAGLPIRYVSRNWDARVWPSASRGYFQMRRDLQITRGN